MEEQEDIEQFINSLSDLNDETSGPKVPFDEVKDQVGLLTDKLAKLTDKKNSIEDELTNVNKEISRTQAEILKIWGPYIEGSDKSQVDLGDYVLSAQLELNPSVENMDVVVEWLQQNQPDVLKYQVHHSTLKSIAKKLYKDGEEIPGLKYSTYRKIKVK